jgi:hypothetical protein
MINSVLGPHWTEESVPSAFTYGGVEAKTSNGNPSLGRPILCHW